MKVLRRSLGNGKSEIIKLKDKRRNITSNRDIKNCKRVLLRTI